MDADGKPNYETTTGMIEHLKTVEPELAEKMKLIFEKCHSAGNIVYIKLLLSCRYQKICKETKITFFVLFYFMIELSWTYSVLKGTKKGIPVFLYNFSPRCASKHANLIVWHIHIGSSY